MAWIWKYKGQSFLRKKKFLLFNSLKLCESLLFCSHSLKDPCHPCIPLLRMKVLTCPVECWVRSRVWCARPRLKLKIWFTIIFAQLHLSRWEAIRQGQLGLFLHLWHQQLQVMINLVMLVYGWLVKILRKVMIISLLFISLFVMTIP